MAITKKLLLLALVASLLAPGAADCATCDLECAETPFNYGGFGSECKCKAKQFSCTSNSCPGGCGGGSTTGGGGSTTGGGGSTTGGGGSTTGGSSCAANETPCGTACCKPGTQQCDDAANNKCGCFQCKKSATDDTKVCIDDCPNGNTCINDICAAASSTSTTGSTSSTGTDTTSTSTSTGTSDPCFAAETTKACKLLEPTATASAALDACYKTKNGGAAEAVLMATLAAGDKVLTVASDGGLAVTRVIVNQHAATDDRAKMLTLTTSDGATLSLTPEHGLFIDGALAAAADAKVGSALTRADGSAVTVKRITEADAARVIMPVTAAGTILASDRGTPVLAAAHLMKYASLYKYAAGRAFAGAVLYVVGDVTDWTAFGATLVAKLAAPLAAAALLAKALKRGASAK